MTASPLELRQKVECTLEAVRFGVTRLLDSLGDDNATSGEAGKDTRGEAGKEASIFAFIQLILEQSFGTSRGVCGMQ